MKPVIIRAGNFWDGISEKPLGPREILVPGETIAEIGISVSKPEGLGFVMMSGTVTKRDGKPAL
jgi:hypothetical protein